MEEAIRYQIKIDRPIYEHDQLRRDYEYNKCKKRKCKLLEKSFFFNRLILLTGISCNSHTDCKRIVLRTVPALEWLSHYKWRKNLLADIIAGFTVAIMHIPQGMAYGLLGNVPPVVGIYMAFFPVLIYFFLGTSRHNSMGKSITEKFYFIFMNL